MKVTIGDILLSTLQARFIGKTIIPPDMSLPQVVVSISLGPEDGFLPTWVFSYEGGGSGVFYLDDKFEIEESLCPTSSNQ